MSNPERDYYNRNIVNKHCSECDDVDPVPRHKSDEYFDKTFKAVGDEEDGKIRKFDTGATRDTDDGKLDYEGFLSPSALKRYAEYMHSHRKQSDGKIRDSDNWQKGIPLTVYMKSLWRHVADMWMLHRIKGSLVSATMEDTICAVIFNAFGYLHEITKYEDDVPVDPLAKKEEPKPTGCFYCTFSGSCSLLKDQDDCNGEKCSAFTRKKDPPANEEGLKGTCDRCNCYNACALPQKDRGAMLHVCVSFVRKKDPPAKKEARIATCDSCNCYAGCSLSKKDRGAMLVQCVSFVRKRYS